MRALRPAPRWRLRGVTLVELMIGMTLGLIVTVGTLGLLSGQLRSNRELLTSARLNSELRATMDTMVRDVRRAGYWGGAERGTWFQRNPTPVANPFDEVTVGTGTITYRYDANADGVLQNGETFRLELDADAGVVELHTQGSDDPVPLNDPEVTEVTGLAFELVERETSVTCLHGGAGPVALTPPVLTVRELRITLDARLREDTAVTRSLTERVRLRNDLVAGSCPS